MSAARGRKRRRTGAPGTESHFAGFTLIELLVVLAIAGALLAIVPVALHRYKESADYRDAVRMMAAGLAEARRAAINGGRPVAFSVNLTDRQFGVEGRNARPLPESLEVRATVAGIELTDGVANIRFFPGGNSTGGSIEILRPVGSGARLRTDWLNGRIDVERWPQ